ncbi:serine/threonine-protein kinase [Actinocorallia populi]|uniref:serine/threonine-protein kinase n=1 Tax=Actinocorallia populi TaxID=2079200 RepID=UPI000D097AF7|nr:serine/threonine-protein kinase [Actinocorallia populi]
MTQGEERLLGGRYRLDRMLGRGGMGTVWHAVDEVLSRSVAVKEVITPPGLDDGARAVMHERMLREARAAARLTHPGIVTVHDVVEEDGVPWIVMEFVQARTLQDVVDAEGPLPVSRVAEIGRQLLGALRAAHAAGILHRDVKPANVMLSQDRAILTDFGIAQMEGDASLTQTGIVMGSPSYLSPERAQGLKPGAPSDLWALGATLFTAVEGFAAFERPEVLSTLAAVMMEPVPPMQRGGPLVPVIHGLLEKDPDTRLNAAAAAELLHRVDTAPPLTTTAPDRSRHEFQATAALVEERPPVGEGFDSLYRPGHMPARPSRQEEPAPPTFHTASALPPVRHAPPPRQPAYEPTQPPVYEQPQHVYEPAPAVYEPTPQPVSYAYEQAPQPVREQPQPVYHRPPTQPSHQPSRSSDEQWIREIDGGRRPARPSRPGGRGLGFSALVGSVVGILAIVAMVFVLKPTMIFGEFKKESGDGFSIEVPRNWEKRTDKDYIIWNDPDTDAYVHVDWRDWSAEHGTVKASLKSLRNGPTFEKEIGLRGARLAGQEGAELEYRFYSPTKELRHGINRRAKVEGKAWAVLVAFPADEWPESKDTALNILDSFQP